MISHITDTGYERAFAEFVPFTATLQRSHGPRTVDRSVLDHFLAKLEQPAPENPNACWKWAGLINKGTPLFAMGSVLITAHRLAWILYHRCDPPDDAMVRVSCETPHCVHPLHATATPRKKVEYKPFAPSRPRRAEASAAEADPGFTIEELAPPEIQRLASAQFGDNVNAPRLQRRMTPWPAAVEISAPKVTLLPTTRREPKPAATPSPILLDDIIALLSIPGTALITYPSKETTLMSPMGTYAGSDLLSLFLSAITDAGYRKVAA